jgi:hypothetical protein
MKAHTLYMREYRANLQRLEEPMEIRTWKNQSLEEICATVGMPISIGSSLELWIKRFYILSIRNKDEKPIRSFNRRAFVGYNQYSWRNSYKGNHCA